MSLDAPRRDLVTLRLQLQERYGNAPSYAKLWSCAVNGKIPAYRIGRSWTVDEADVPRVAEFFGLTTSAPTGAA
jgi:hypothetical protein